MNGSITAKSQLGQGATFCVCLNFRKSMKPLIKPDTNITTDHSLQGYRVLAAEDILANQILLKHLLKKWGAEFIVCDNGQEVLNWLEKQEFDIILMDLQMPVMDGITAMKIIRKSLPAYSRIPVIAFTADTFAESTPEIAECNFSDFVTKPFKSEELIKIITRHLPVS